MKAVMISIQPKQCGQIANGKQTVLVRKTKPKIDVPFKCYIYCTTAIKKTNILWGSRLRGKYYYCDDRSHNLCDAPLNKTVICEFVCDTVWCIVKEKPQDLTKTVDNQPKEYYTNNKGAVKNIFNSDYENWSWSNNTHEVIGNIHDNPYLLEESK